MLWWFQTVLDCVTCLAAGQLSELLLRLVPSLSSTTSAIAPLMAQCEAFSVLCEGLRWEMERWSDGLRCSKSNIQVRIINIGIDTKSSGTEEAPFQRETYLPRWISRSVASVASVAFPFLLNSWSPTIWPGITCIPWSKKRMWSPGRWQPDSPDSKSWLFHTAWRFLGRKVQLWQVFGNSDLHLEPASWMDGLTNQFSQKAHGQHTFLLGTSFVEAWDGDFDHNLAGDSHPHRCARLPKCSWLKVGICLPSELECFMFEWRYLRTCHWGCAGDCDLLFGVAFLVNQRY